MKDRNIHCRVTKKGDASIHHSYQEPKCIQEILCRSSLLFVPVFIIEEGLKFDLT